MTNLFQGIFSNSLESLFNINTFLGRGFKIGNVVFPSAPCHCALGRYLFSKVNQTCSLVKLKITGRT